MPFNGVGQFISLGAPNFPAVPDTVIVSVYYNNTILDLMAGLGQCLTRDGQSVPSSDLPMAGFKFTGLGASTASGQALIHGQSGAVLTSLSVTALTVPTQPTATTDGLAASTAFVHQITDLLAPLASPILTGIPEAPTAPPGTSTDQIASTAFVAAQAFSTALPAQTGQSGKVVTTNGVSASWVGVATVGGQSLLGRTDVLMQMPEVAVAATTQLMVAGSFYSFNNAALSTGSLPATPSNGDTVGFYFTNGRFDNVIARNGQTILGVAEDFLVDDLTFPVFMRFTNNTWRII